MLSANESTNYRQMESQPRVVVKCMKKLISCLDCSKSEKDAPVDALGNELPYGCGLMGCLIHGVGHYPFQKHSCSDFR